MRGWRGRWRNLLYDVAPPVVLLALGLIDVFTESLAVIVGSAPAVTAIVPGAMACLALLLRRYRPLLTLVIVLLAVLVPPLILPTSLTYWDEFMTLVLALYSCARHLHRRGAFVALALSAIGMAVLPFEFPDMRNAGDLLYNSVVLAVAFAIGLLARSWTGYRERSLREAAERAVAEERASRAERARIARELHDVIAHTITVIVMQAGGARLASATDPAIAATTLAQIEELGRASLAELRTLLPLLHDGGGDGDDADADAPIAPQPTLADVGALCERMRTLGLPVTLFTEGGTVDIPLGLQLTGFRVVQEGLTNVIKHSGTVATTVTIRHRQSPAVLTIEVASPAPAGAPRLPGSGRGLAGIEERVRLAGGTFSAGRQDEAGFLLRVELPLERELA
jgi:signal transduction histidine kinase